MTQIAQDQPVVTLINVFTVTPGDQLKLVEVLIEATDQVMCKQPGFVSANIHRSLDGTRVTNYAQWRSRADYEAIFRDPEVTPHLEKCQQLATFAAAIYEVVHVSERV